MQKQLQNTLWKDMNILEILSRYRNDKKHF